MALINCPECKKEVSKEATTCPHCGYKLKKKTGCLSWIGIIILVVVGLVIIEMTTKDKTSNRDFTNERMAYNLSKDYVLQNIKSPKTATFPSLLESKNHIKDLGGGRYQINSWVDSQNSFGATIRTNFSCIMINKGRNRWDIENLMFIE